MSQSTEFEERISDNENFFENQNEQTYSKDIELKEAAKKNADKLIQLITGGK